jgi:hypothetical protein
LPRAVEEQIHASEHFFCPLDSKKFRDEFGHTPVSVEEKIPWRCKRLIIGTVVQQTSAGAFSLRSFAREMSDIVDPLPEFGK